MIEYCPNRKEVRAVQTHKSEKAVVPEDRYRHEYKYVIDDLQLALLKARAASVMQPDPHVDPQGQYRIRSLYFDDWNNSCFYDNENGTDPREKFRIRIYNCRDDRISLELKRKEAGKTLKKSCPLTREQAERLAAGEILSWRDDWSPLLKKLYLLQSDSLLRPKTIVEYVRIPFVYPDGNVRVTFDTELRASSDVTALFRADLPGRPIMPLGKQLMEVKFDEFLPDHIHRSLQTEHLRQTAFSKYYLCRKFGGYIV